MCRLVRTIAFGPVHLISGSAAEMAQPMLSRIRDKITRVPERMGRLRPTLSEPEVTAFEHAHRVTLPDEYRAFLLNVGNGGLGPGGGLAYLADAVRRSPTPTLDIPFPFTFREHAERHARFAADVDAGLGLEAIARALARHGGVPPRERPQWRYAQPGVLYLAEPDPPWCCAYLIVTGEDRGSVWMYGGECGWDPEAPTSGEDEKQVDKPPRTFLRWYEDWLDEVLASAYPAEPGAATGRGLISE